jgi:hypothetical protein
MGILREGEAPAEPICFGRAKLLLSRFASGNHLLRCGSAGASPTLLQLYPDSKTG